MRDNMNERGFKADIVPGELICQKRIFGYDHRYAVAPALQETGEIIWYLWDSYERAADGSDKAGLIAQSKDLASLIKDLPGLEEPKFD